MINISAKSVQREVKIAGGIYDLRTPSTTKISLSSKFLRNSNGENPWRKTYLERGYSKIKGGNIEDASDIVVFLNKTEGRITNEYITMIISRSKRYLETIIR